MQKIIVLFAMLVSSSIMAFNADCLDHECQEHANDYAIDEIQVIELEEEIDIYFDTTQYLPEGFNALKGMHDLDWSKIELIELEEEIEINFDTKQYLPKNFNALKGLHDIDWNTVELLEIEENIEIGFNPKKYLPKNFNPFKGLCLGVKRTLIVRLI